MEFSGLGGGIMVALAAGLWLVYLMPTWFKRRDYIATERLEVRRQQALRVLREVSAAPSAKPIVPVSAIVSSTGIVKDRDRLAEAIRRSKDAQAARMASRQFTEEAGMPVQAVTVKAGLTRRIRRTRAAAVLLLALAAVTLAIELGVMVATGISVAAAAVTGFAVVIGVVSFAALARLATIARRRASAPIAVRQPLRKRMAAERDVAEGRPESPSWTPVPIPKPMYLSRAKAPAEAGAAGVSADAVVAGESATVDPVEQLRLAAIEAERALRAAQAGVPGVVPEAGESAAAASASPYAAMGLLGGTDVSAPDLDEVLRRRRAG